MLKYVKNTLLYSLYVFIGVIIILISTVSIVYYSVDIEEPILSVDKNNIHVVDYGTHKQQANSVFRKSESGLLEVKVEGDAQERGIALGALLTDYLEYQEKVFVDQILQIITSEKYLKFLRIMLIIFNRNLDEHIPQEYLIEIAGISKYCTDKYNAIGSPYERQINYHAAHDIGHTMQQYMLVGCSSFILGGKNTKNGELLVGRNFDFYVGDDFARNKLMLFVEPTDGYKFASITWPGMIGVLSGMNEKGLTVTINAAKGAMPTSSSTPISILVREILQYASNIEEAINIAKKRKLFVSESILIASKNDKRAVIIEKTPSQMDVYEKEEFPLICANHYQSELLKNTKENITNIETSDSKYRFDRLKELIDTNKKYQAEDVAAILRNRYGKGGEDIGFSNEMTINQSIAHHAVIFMPESGLMWVSTPPWQSGKFVCYDLNKIFDSSCNFSDEVYVKSLEIMADTLFLNTEYDKIIQYRKGIKTIKEAISSEQTLPIEYIAAFEQINPQHYYTYRILGDYYRANQKEENASEYYELCLQKTIPRLPERKKIESFLK